MIETIQEPAVQQLIRSPKLPLYVQEFQVLLQEEREKRERFYDEMSEQQKVEFINGKIMIQSPVKLRHSIASQNLFTLLDTYVRKHRLGFVGHEKILITLTRNDYEPDTCYFGNAKAQGFYPDQIKFPAPDFVVELVSPATEAIDRGIKFEDYAAHGVSEYWIIAPQEEHVEQYGLKDEAYDLLVKVKTGILQSVAVRGFDIPVRAIFDENEHLATLQAILER